MRRAKRADPVTFVLSPTLTNRELALMLNASKPLSLHAGSIEGIFRGGIPSIAAAIAAICSGDVPQQPPTILRNPLAANSLIIEAISSGLWSYSPNSFGKPAFGCAET